MRTPICPARFGVISVAMAIALAAVAPWAIRAAEEPRPDAPAEFVVTDTVLRPAEKVPPLGANGWGACGSVEWAANNFVKNAGNEPIYWRNLHRVQQCGENWFEIDGPGTSWYALYASGFLSGANLRIYRLVDAQDRPLPPRANGDYLDIAKADHVQFVGKTTIIPEGTPGFPDGGWIADTYSLVYPNAEIRHGNLTATDPRGLENGRTYWYVVVALGADGQVSDISNEVSATPQAGIDTPPHIVCHGNGERLPAVGGRGNFRFTPKLYGGNSPYRWEVVDTLPDGLQLDAATGRISGSMSSPPVRALFHLKVTDAKGRSDSRAYTLGAEAASKAGAKPAKPAAKAAKPSPPRVISAVAGDGCVTVSWEASQSPNVVAYRLKRSTTPAARQMQRVYVSPGAPKLEKWDYVVLEKRFDNFNMKYVNARVRGIENPADVPSWHWESDSDQVLFSLVPHPQPLPAEMDDPGETCLQVRASAGTQHIRQGGFCGTEPGGEIGMGSWSRTRTTAWRSGCDRRGWPTTGQ